MRLISQLIKIISRVPQKLFKYFNGAAVFLHYHHQGFFTVILNLDLNITEFSVASAGLSL